MWKRERSMSSPTGGRPFESKASERGVAFVRAGCSGMVRGVSEVTVERLQPHSQGRNAMVMDAEYQAF